MKDIVRGIFSFSCDECNHRHDIPDDTAEFHQIDTEDDDPDSEHKYVWSLLNKCSCGAVIHVNYTIWEYPLGEFSNAEIDITGGTLIDEFDYDFNEGPDEDAYDDDEGELEW